MARPQGALGPIHTEPQLGGAYSGTNPSCVVNIARGGPRTFLSTQTLLHTFLAQEIPLGVGVSLRQCKFALGE